MNMFECLIFEARTPSSLGWDDDTLISTFLALHTEYYIHGNSQTKLTAVDLKNGIVHTFGTDRRLYDDRKRTFLPLCSLRSRSERWPEYIGYELFCYAPFEVYASASSLRMR